MKMKLKIKIFPYKLYPINIFVSNIEILHAHCLKLSTLFKFGKLGYFKTIWLSTILYSFVLLKQRQQNYNFNIYISTMNSYRLEIFIS